MKFCFIGVLVIFLSNTFVKAQPLLPAGFASQVIYKGKFPIAFAADNDNHLFIAEKTGRIVLIDDDQPVGTLIQLVIESCCEHGLLGITLDPDFALNHYVYVFYTVYNENHNRVSRLEFNEEHLKLENEQVIFDLEPLSGEFHSGGCMRFGPDGKLYIGSGDGSDSRTSQNLNSVMGKILRINSDGTIPIDNPFYNTSTGIHRAIYAYGLRNPFSFSFNEDGRLFVNDVGYISYEEINEVFAGKNYGWPLVEGFSAGSSVPDNYVEPIYAYSHDEGCAITGSVFYPRNSLAFPEEFRGKYLFGDYCNAVIRMMDPQTKEVSVFASDAISPTCLVVQNGALYFTSSNNEQIIKIFFSGDGSPILTSQPKSAICSVNDSIQFSVSVAGEPPFTYQWLMNGEILEGETNDTLVVNNVQIAANGSTISCIVTNGKGVIESQSATLSVSSRHRPEVFIDISHDGIKYRAGDTLVINGMATDEVQGDLPDSLLTWNVFFHHNTHVHPVFTNLQGVDSISIVVPRIGETSSNVWYSIALSTVNDVGLTSMAEKDVYPATSTFTVKASTDSLIVYMDGKPLKTPFEISGVVGMTRIISIDKSQYLNDSIYYFTNWNTNKISSSSITFNIGASDTVYQANYSSAFLGMGGGLKALYFNNDSAGLGSPVLERIDNSIDFDWGRYSADPSVKVDSFAVVWSGYLTVPENDLYTFYIVADDAVKLDLDSEVIINDVGSSNSRQSVGQKYLHKGKPVRITLSYTEIMGYSSIRLYWSSSRILKSIVPPAALYDSFIPRIILQSSSKEGFVMGENIALTGKAINGFGHSIDQNGFQWDLKYFNDGDTVEYVTETGTKSFDYVVRDLNVSNEQSGIKVTLRVTDEYDISRDTTIFIYPRIAALTVQSEFDFPFFLKGAKAALPLTKKYIAGDSTFYKAKTALVSNDTLRVTDQLLWNESPFLIVKDTTITIPWRKIPLSNGNGLTGYYLNGFKNFDETIDSVKVDEKLNFGFNPGGNALKIHWIGWITPPLSASYNVTVSTTQSASLSIENKLFKVDKGTVVTDVNPIYLKKGQFYPIELFYEVDQAGDTVILEWESAELPSHVVPRNQLFTNIKEAPDGIVNIYPNPFHESIHFKFSKSNGSDQVDIALHNSSGEVVFQKTYQKGNAIDINVGDLPPGVYILRLLLGGKPLYYKVVKR